MRKPVSSHIADVAADCNIIIIIIVQITTDHDNGAMAHGPSPQTG